jgi:hypothetical protein
MTRALDRIVAVEELSSQTSQQLQTLDAEALKRTTDVLALQNIEEVLPVPADPEHDIEAITAVAPVDGVFEIYPCVRNTGVGLAGEFKCKHNGVDVPYYDGIHIPKLLFRYTEQIGAGTPVTKSFTDYFYPYEISTDYCKSQCVPEFPHNILIDITVADAGGYFQVDYTPTANPGTTITDLVILEMDLVVVRQPDPAVKRLLTYKTINELEKYHESKALNSSIRRDAIIEAQP